MNSKSGQPKVKRWDHSKKYDTGVRHPRVQCCFDYICDRQYESKWASAWIWKVMGLYSDTWLGKWLKMRIYSSVWDLNSHSQPPNHRKGSGPGFSLVEQSWIAALWQVFVHVTQETPQKWSRDLGFGCIFASVWMQPWHTDWASASNFTSRT